MCDPVLSRILLLAVARVTREGARKNFTDVAEHRPGFQRRMAFFYNKNCSVLHHLCIYLCASPHYNTSNAIIQLAITEHQLHPKARDYIQSEEQGLNFFIALNVEETGLQTIMAQWDHCWVSGRGKRQWEPEATDTKVHLGDLQTASFGCWSLI